MFVEQSGGTIAGAVVGTILGVAALAGAIVAVMLFLKGRKHGNNYLHQHTSRAASVLVPVQLAKLLGVV